MDVAGQSGSAEINYSLCNAIVSASRHSNHSAGEDTTATGSSSSSGRLLHSDTLFDQSSAEETVIPYLIGERASRDYNISSASLGTFDPESSPKSHLSRVASRRTIDTDYCGTLYEETVQAEMEANQTARSTTDPEGIEECQESQRLVNSPVHQSQENTARGESQRRNTGKFGTVNRIHSQIPPF